MWSILLYIYKSIPALAKHSSFSYKSNLALKPPANGRCDLGSNRSQPLQPADNVDHARSTVGTRMYSTVGTYDLRVLMLCMYVSQPYV
jgi:hypothetical protein